MSPLLQLKTAIFFAVSTGAISVAANGFLVVQVSNPPSSGKLMYIARISGGSTTNTTIDVIRNGTFTDAGTPLTPRNTNTLFTDNSIMTAKYITQATAPTVGGFILNTIIETGGPVDIEYNGRIIISANNTLLVRLVNNTNQVNILSLNVSWWRLS